MDNIDVTFVHSGLRTGELASIQSNSAEDLGRVLDFMKDFTKTHEEISQYDILEYLGEGCGRCDKRRCWNRSDIERLEIEWSYSVCGFAMYIPSCTLKDPKKSAKLYLGIEKRPTESWQYPNVCYVPPRRFTPVQYQELSAKIAQLALGFGAPSEGTKVFSLDVGGIVNFTYAGLEKEDFIKIAKNLLDRSIGEHQTYMQITYSDDFFKEEK